MSEMLGDLSCLLNPASSMPLTADPLSQRTPLREQRLSLSMLSVQSLSRCSLRTTCMPHPVCGSKPPSFSDTHTFTHMHTHSHSYTHSHTLTPTTYCHTLRLSHTHILTHKSYTLSLTHTHTHSLLIFLPFLTCVSSN